MKGTIISYLIRIDLGVRSTPHVPGVMPPRTRRTSPPTAAQGYVELGMHLDADEELEQIDHAVRHVLEVLELRLLDYSALQKWELMQMVGKKLALYAPKNVLWTFSWAYATRRADCIETAQRILLNALEAHPDEALLHYNLACYCCQIGDIGGAKERLEKAFRLAPGLRETALTDVNLEPLWRSYCGKLEDRCTN